MLWLAFKILFQERGRLVITLVGSVFSTVLTLMDVAIDIGMMRNATGVVRHTDADIFIILFVVIVLTCLVAAYVSVRKVKALDPAIVFRE
ncbi:MAG: Uncharacterized protein FD165_1624 [Gammaproteobacteria bacterium]|nr:MAG: Uncharacterized protein FD165_1624 [Gammaproteobacteria bacterium]TND05534.1 MAG: Uncharacterized protein FD120_1142 [Gammaproteobacteria bacterium]